jgi:hypothetical protein
MHSKTLRNPSTQKLFKEYYYDKDKLKNSTGRTAPTSGSK